MFNSALSLQFYNKGVNNMFLFWGNVALLVQLASNVTILTCTSYTIISILWNYSYT